MKRLISSPVFFLLLLLSGCKTDTLVIMSDTTKPLGAMTLSFGAVPDGIVRVIARLSRAGYADHTMSVPVSDSGNSASGAFTNIPGGTWLLRVDALDSARVAQYSDSAYVDIVPGRTTVVTLELSASNGNLEIHVVWGKPCTPAPDGLVGWWPADGNAHDIVRGNNGTVNGVTFAVGQVGDAFSFNGVNGRITLPDAENLRFTGSFTIEMWINIESIPPYPGNYILMRGDDRASLDPYGVGITPEGKLGFEVTSETSSTSIHANVESGRFTHIAATLDSTSGSMRLYVDGVLGAETITNVRPFRDLDSNLNAGIGIGNTPYSSFNFPFHGLIDEVSMYSRALSAQEISAIFSAGRSGKCRQK